MDYVDSILIKLADPALRTGIFDDASLEQMAAAAYDADTMALEGPYKAVFEEFRLGFSVSPLSTIEGSWSPSGSTERVDARLQLSGLSPASALRVDAFWRGRIIARGTLSHDTVSSVRTVPTQWNSIDADIVAELGALPADRVVLEQQRRTRLLQRIRAGFNVPAAATEKMLDQWLVAIGAGSVSEVITSMKGVVEAGTVQVRFAPGPPPEKLPKPLPIVATILVRDAGFSLAELLFQSKAIRELLEPQGFSAAQDPGLRVKQNLLVVWIVPGKVFDDAAWPGGDGLNGQALQDARRKAAGAWLGKEGIGLVVTG